MSEKSIQHLCLLIAVESGLVDALAAADAQKGVSAGELAAAIGYDEDFISNAMEISTSLVTSTKL